MTRLSVLPRIRLPVTLALLSFTSQTIAVCDRDDIDYYLGKGFTTDQITSICTSATPSASKSGQSAAATRPHDASSDEDLLKEAIKARDVSLTDSALHYTLKVCIEYGEEDLFGFTPRACPQVSYSIALEGLEIIDSGKKYVLYGTDEILVRSSITRELIEGIEELKPEQRHIVLNKLETGDQTAIPIREDIPLETVEQVLRRLAN